MGLARMVFTLGLGYFHINAFNFVLAPKGRSMVAQLAIEGVDNGDASKVECGVR
jgi:hypothetical protein